MNFLKYQNEKTKTVLNELYQIFNQNLNYTTNLDYFPIYSEENFWGKLNEEFLKINSQSFYCYNSKTENTNLVNFTIAKIGNFNVNSVHKIIFSNKNESFNFKNTSYANQDLCLSEIAKYTFENNSNNLLVLDVINNPEKVFFDLNLLINQKFNQIKTLTIEKRPEYPFDHNTNKVLFKIPSVFQTKIKLATGKETFLEKILLPKTNIYFENDQEILNYINNCLKKENSQKKYKNILDRLYLRDMFFQSVFNIVVNITSTFNFYNFIGKDINFQNNKNILETLEI